MVSFLLLPEETRRLLIGQASTQGGITESAIEKDWWVTLTLQALFSLPMAEHFVFKGGTSLSKGWGLIQRFSEDIDIALAPEGFGRKYEEKPSSSYVKRLKREGCAYTTTVIREALEGRFAVVGVPAGMIRVEAEDVAETHPDKDPQTLFVHFASLYNEHPYLTPPVKIEFSVRSLREPFATIQVRSLLSEFANSPAYRETPFPVTAVEPRKTFMEKLLLLHEKFGTGRATGEVGERQSRHLFDLWQMSRRGILTQVMGDPELYTAVKEHRRHYIRLKDVDYDAMELRQLLFLPPYELLDSFGKDYATMRSEMIYGDAPDFEGLLTGLRELNLQFVSIGHTKGLTEVIQRALSQIEEAELDGDFVRTAVIYTNSPELSAGPDKNTIHFAMEFIKTKNKFMLHRINILQ